MYMILLYKMYNNNNINVIAHTATSHKSFDKNDD